jgi:hypothetical protein
MCALESGTPVISLLHLLAARHRAQYDALLRGGFCIVAVAVVYGSAAVHAP